MKEAARLFRKFQKRTSKTVDWNLKLAQASKNALSELELPQVTPKELWEGASFLVGFALSAII